MILFSFTGQNSTLTPVSDESPNEFAEWHMAWFVEWHNYAEWLKMKSATFFGANLFAKAATFLTLRAQLRYQKSMKDSLISTLAANRAFSLAWPLAFTRSFAWLVCRVVDVFTPLEKGENVSLGAYNTNQLRDWQATRMTSLTLKAMQERNLHSQGTLLLTVNSPFLDTPTCSNKRTGKAVAPLTWRHKKARQRRAHAVQFNLFLWVILHILYSA